MSGSSVFGKARLPQPLGPDECRELPLSETTSAVLVELVTGGGGPLPFKTKWGSGRLVGAAIASDGFVADKGDSLLVAPIQYPVGSGTLNVKLNLFVSANDFVATTTRFEIWRNGVASGNFIDVLAGAFGATVSATFALGFGVGERFDLRVSNPGGAAEVGKAIEFGMSADFF